MPKRIVFIRQDGGEDSEEVVVSLDRLADLRQVRGNIMDSDGSRIQVAPDLGLSVRLTAMADLFNSGNMGVIRGVSLPYFNMSHFSMTDKVHGVEGPGGQRQPGWIAAHLDPQHPTFPTGFPSETYPHPFGLAISSSQHDIMKGAEGNYTYATTNPSVLAATIPGAGGALPDTPQGRAMARIINTKVKRDAYNNTVKAVHDQGVNRVTYPSNNNLASQLKFIARQIDADVQTQFFFARIAGFDTHADQKAALTTLLLQTDAAIAAFTEDLTAAGKFDETLVVMYTEFGRNLASNASNGTDHGRAWTMKYFGPSSWVQPTQVLGTSYQFDPAAISSDSAIPQQYDLRDIQQTILVNWLGKPAVANGRTLLPFLNPPA